MTGGSEPELTTAAVADDGGRRRVHVRLEASTAPSDTRRRGRRQVIGVRP
jgi:hypothetical protein